MSKNLVKRGLVLVNDEHKKASYSLALHDLLEIKLPKSKAPSKIDFKVLYEDEDCLVIDKPEGVLSHSKGALSAEYTVSNFVEDRLGIASDNRTGIVHRLDRATSGVMICAKSETARVFLQKQFSNRRVKKTYFAVIRSGLNPSKAIIDMPIERNPKDPKRFRAGFGGKSALTKYEIKQDDGDYSLVRLSPETGRTHQLRVHLAKLGYPIIGDGFYGGEEADRMYLHASELELTLPRSQRATFKSELPAQFKENFKFE